MFSCSKCRVDETCRLQLRLLLASVLDSVEIDPVWFLIDVFFATTTLLSDSNMPICADQKARDKSTTHRGGHERGRAKQGLVVHGFEFLN